MSDRMLVVDDDETFRKVLTSAMQRRGFQVHAAADANEAIAASEARSFDYAVVDLRMPGPSGLTAVETLARRNPQIRIVVLTGYASIATAVEAIKLGAIHYLTKPANADEILAAFAREQGDVGTPVPESPPSIGRLEWEHIQRVYELCNRNVSETARRLNMHRRTLQRKLQKRPVKT